MSDIHKGGRPPIQRPEGFYENLLREYETMTIRQMAESHKVTRTTISRWLRIARSRQQGGVAHGEQQES